jgi:hypothetical protein
VKNISSGDHQPTRKEKHSMKTWLLPITTTLGAASAFALMLATQAAPAAEDNTEAMRPIQRMEQPSRPRDMTRADKDSTPAAGDRKASDRGRAKARAADDDAQRERGDGRDRRGDDGHDDDDGDAS